MEKYKVIERSKDTGSTHSLLNEGMVPGIVYGKGTEPTKIAFENKVLLKLMHTGAFYSTCLLYTSPSPRDGLLSRMPSSA